MNKEMKMLIPHREKMALIDSIINHDKEKFSSQVIISKDMFLCEEKGVPSFAGVEFMAQTIAAYNKLHLNAENRSNIGFIIAVRKYQALTNIFPIGAKLKVSIEPVLIIESSGSFNCKIEQDNTMIAEGRITAYVPTDSELSEFKEVNYE